MKKEDLLINSYFDIDDLLDVDNFLKNKRFECYFKD
jgi:hypothetical protein